MTVRIEVTIGAPPDQVWRALRDPELIRRWHGWHFGEAGSGLDEEIRLIYVDHVPEEDPEGRVLVLQDSDRFTLHETADGGTLVRITRAPRGANPDWDAYYDDITEGWTAFLTQLRFGVERHGLAERRTVALTGALRDPAASMLDALGLGAVADLPVGSPYKAEAVPGDVLEGEVYAVAGHQRALTVAGFGDGLLLVGGRGGIGALLTLYGTPDDRFGDIEHRWTSWWETVKTPDDGAGAETEGPGQ
ncbi:hypothetical protein C1I98_24210 [Spongiactinospora gelatinilytica]|uniref:SRPBCC domain-containing protein n=1 Tax=Spongiactinospora gelatinilytica TaxID=2666298 RepID=A0A2W2GN51_9ACTN|nr:SRPBCC domain-containing protein [Spongiactinospora gelatinilytica]PZG38790.1 hypothetical protein C1I98_24210 [Spongiactinospora gelatinilytica]